MTRVMRAAALTVMVGTAAGLVACQKKLDTDIKKASYAIGQQIGTNLKSQQIDFDADVMGDLMH